MELIDPTSELAPETPAATGWSHQYRCNHRGYIKPKGDVFLNRLRTYCSKKGSKLVGSRRFTRVAPDALRRNCSELRRGR